jgi:hypothetical protein
LNAVGEEYKVYTTATKHAVALISLFTMTSFGELSDVMMTAKKNDVHIASMNS